MSNKVVRSDLREQTLDRYISHLSEGTGLGGRSYAMNAGIKNTVTYHAQDRELIPVILQGNTGINLKPALKKEASNMNISSNKNESSKINDNEKKIKTASMKIDWLKEAVAEGLIK